MKIRYFYILRLLHGKESKTAQDIWSDCFHNFRNFDHYHDASQHGLFFIHLVNT